MINQKELRRLARYESDAPILSVYLNVDSTQHTNEEVLLSLRNMLKEAQGLAAPEDIGAIQRYLEREYDWSGRGLVGFSCAAAGFWHIHTLAVPVTSGVTVARRPYLSPLAALMNAYGQYAVAQVDRQGVRLFLFSQGELVQQDSFEGHQVRKLKRGRGSSGGPGRRGGAPVSSRQQEEAAMQNLRESAKAAGRFFRRHKPQRVVLAGAEPTVNQFRDLLSKSMQGLVVGVMSIGTGNAEAEMRERSLEILQQAEEKRKERLVEAVFTAAAKGREGVVGLDETLSAAHQGRIRTLVIDRDFHAPGYRCSQCGHLTTQKPDACPFCGGSFAQIPDAAEAVVTKVIEDGMEIEVVDRHRRLEQVGVGALLRY